MLLNSHSSDPANAGTVLAEEEVTKEPDVLPAIWRTRDLALLIILITLIVPDTRGMQFAGRAVFFYWFLAFLTFQIPSLCVFSWLIHQAPPNVPIAIWLLSHLNERWRSVVLFLLWWCGVLIVLATLGICLSLLQPPFTSWFSTFPAQCLAFVVLLILATLLTGLPARLFRRVLWVGGLLYLAAFALIIVATIVALILNHGISTTFPHPVFAAFTAHFALPTHFSWSLFGLALLSLFGLNGPLLLDGEMRGEQRFLRTSTGFLWWGGIGTFLIILISSSAWILMNTPAHTAQTRIFLTVEPILGPWAPILGWLLLFLGSFGCALAYLIIFSRAFLLAARERYLPRTLAQLNNAGTPVIAILTQSVIIICAAALLFIVMHEVLKALFPADLVDEFTIGDQFSLLTSVAGSLWCLLTTPMFLFACWLYLKKGRHTRQHRLQRLLLPILCLSGALSALICASAPLLPDWPMLFYSRNRWFPLISLGVACSLALAWVIGELPRRAMLLREREQSLTYEKALHTELQQIYARECDLHNRLREAYEGQQFLLLKQRSLLDEVNRLYREQEQVAMTDSVTGLLTRRAFLERLHAEIEYCQEENLSFLLFFLDLDHFKAINDTWGHLAGDAVLREVAERLQQTLRPEDAVGRYGGEEFTVIRTNTTLAQARQEGERLRQAIGATPWHWQAGNGSMVAINITTSIGVAAYSIHGTRQEELIEKADLAMYQAKLAGRDCVRIAGHSQILPSLLS